MQETLLEKAKRLGIQPSGQPMQESLLDKANRLGIKPAGQEEEVGGFKSFVRAVAKPALKIASSARSMGDIVAANSNAEVDAARTKEYDYGYFGKVAGLQGVKDAIGTGAELGSYAIGGGGAAKTVLTGLKGRVLAGVGKGLATGASGGGIMSFGQALQEAEVKPMDVAVRTLLGGTIGGLTGGALGAIAPVVVKAAGTAKRFTNVGQINQELENLNTQVFKPKPSELEKWSVQGKNPMKTYTEIFGTDIPEVGKDNRFTREAIADSVERVNSIYKPAAEGFNTILRNSPEVNSISKARDAAIKNLDAYNLTPEMKAKAIRRIDDNFQAIGDEASKTGKLLGDDSIPVAYSDNLKDRFWAATKNFGTEDATVSNAVNSSIGHGFKDAVENSIENLDVKAYNRQLGDLIVLRDFLETKAGSLAGTGGKMTRLMSRVAGTVVGAQGGPLTAIMGNVTGDKLAQIMINPAYQPYRWLINKQLSKLPPTEVNRLSQEANAVIERMLQARATRLALPEGSKLGTVNNPFIMPAATVDTTMKVLPAKKALPTANPKTGRMQKVYTSETQPLSKSENMPPITKPTTIDAKRNNIPKTVPQTTTKSSKAVDKGVHEVAGGVAGIEVKKDENGKTTITFNPEKAIAGIVGMAAYKKIPAKLKQDVIDTMAILKKLTSKDFVNKRGQLNTEAFGVVEDFFSKAKDGSITKSDIDAAKEVHFLLKGNKEK